MSENAEMKSWWYQLQGHIRLDRKEDLIVMDIDKEPSPYHREGRIVAAYLSIGEAEEYREYWPVPVLFENPDWEGNYAVEFWTEEWRKVVLGRVADARERGFNAIFLDKADVCWDIHQEIGLDYEDMKIRMINLIVAIKCADLGMKLILQNAEDLLEYPEVRRCIWATAHEDLLADTSNTDARVAQMKLHPGPHFAVEYVDLGSKIACQRLAALGAVPLARPADRSLDA